MNYYTKAAYYYDEGKARSQGTPVGIEFYHHGNDSIAVTTAEREDAGLSFESDELTAEQFQSLLDLRTVTH